MYGTKQVFIPMARVYEFNALSIEVYVAVSVAMVEVAIYEVMVDVSVIMNGGAWTIYVVVECITIVEVGVVAMQEHPSDIKELAKVFKTGY